MREGPRAVIDPLRRPAPARAAGRARPFSERDSPFRRGVERDRPLIAVNLVALGALLVGLVLVAGSPTAGFDIVAALGGIVSQLGATLWPAVATVLAVALQVAAGASLVRIVRWGPFRSVAEVLVAGAVGAIGLDVLALLVLGPFGLYGPLPLILLLVPIVVIGSLARPFLLSAPVQTRRIDPLAWVIVAVVWSAPVLLQLASPVAPFVDVLPNHVAPVEHLRTFGSWETLAVSPSPIYGPSRIFLGYVAMLGATSSLSGLDAALTVAAFALPLTMLFAAAGRLLASTLGSQRWRGLGPAREDWEPVDDTDATLAGYWVLLTLPLTFAFLRLPDTRATVLAFVPAALSLVVLLDGSRWPGRSRALVLALSLGVGVMVHPVIGGFAMATVAAMGIASAPRLRPALAGLAGGAVLALPQVALMTGVPASPLVAIPLIVAGLLLAFALGRGTPRDAWAMPRPVSATITLRPVLLGVGVVGLVVIGVAGIVAAGPGALDALGSGGTGAVLDWLLLLVPLVPFVILVRVREAWLTIGAALAVGVAAALAATIVAYLPIEPTVLLDTIAFEVPKSVGYWVPWVLAIAGGVGIAAAWSLRDLPDLVRVGGTAAFLALAAIAPRPDLIEPEAIEQHRYAETLAISLRNAQEGYWIGHPDPRRIVDAPRAALVAAMRAEIAAGRVAATTAVLHVAPSFQQWEATPLGVFAGVLETTATPDAEVSIHTVGGRLRDIADLDLLLGPAYPVVVVEGYDDAVTSRVVDAGYEEIWRNERAVILRRAG